MRQVDTNTFEYEDSTGTTRTWDVHRLWKLSASIHPQRVSINRFKDKIDLWLRRDTPRFSESKGIVSLYLDDFDRIRNADMKYPIILMSNGVFIMDGMHRLMKAWLSGADSVLVAQFVTDPEPDQTTGPVTQPASAKW